MKQLLIALSLITISMVPIKSYSATSVIDPMTIETNVEANSQLFERILNIKDEAERYQSITVYIDSFGPWVGISTSTENVKIHVGSYLLQKGMVSDAVTLLKNNDMEGWLSYRFKDGVANNFLFALDGGSTDFLYALFEHAPSGINANFPVDLQGGMASPLGILASSRYAELPYYESVLIAALSAGGNPHKKLPSGISPMIIASSSNNMDFVRITQTFLSDQDGTVNGLLTNTPLEQSELLEMQAIADALIEKSAEETSQFNYAKLHDLWIQMIMKGYNTPADLIYDELVKRPEFDIDASVEDGLTPLMASTLSNLYGGNVEYAKLLLDRGADPDVLIDIGEEVKVNLIQLSLQNDNHKMVALYISAGVNFVTLPDDDEVFILSQALEQNAFKSAYIIKEALSATLNKDASGE